MSKSKHLHTDILFASHSAELIGGAERALLSLVTYLTSRGIRVHVVAPGPGSLSLALKKIDVPCSFIHLPPWAHAPQDTSDFVFTNYEHNNTAAQLVQLINQINPKLCVSNTIVIPWLAYAAALTSTRHAWVISELGSADHGLHYAIPEADVFHTLHAMSDMIFYNSNYTADYFGRVLPAHRHGLLYPQVSPKRITSVLSPYRPSAVKIIIVGQIKPSKGQLDAVTAIRTLKERGIDIQLAIIGQPEDRLYLQKIDHLIQQANMAEDVLLLGFRQDTFSYLALADIVVVCSPNEAFGMVTVEGMLAKKPVIGANSGGTIEIIEEGKTGLTYKPGNGQDLAAKIATLVTDKYLAKRLGAAAYTVAKRRFSPAQCYKDFLLYYANLDKHPNSGLNLVPLISMLNDLQAYIAALQTHPQTIHDSSPQVSQHTPKLGFIHAVRKVLRLASK